MENLLCVCVCVCLPPKVVPTTCCLLRFIALSSNDALSARHAKTVGSNPTWGAKMKGRKERDTYLRQNPWFCLLWLKVSFELRVQSNYWVSWFCLGMSDENPQMFTAHCCPEMIEEYKCYCHIWQKTIYVKSLFFSQLCSQWSVL